MERVGLFWFTGDLRLHDNPPLRALAAQVDRLVCVACIDPLLSRHCASLLNDDCASRQRQRFMRESLEALDGALGQYHQHLLICHQRGRQALPMLIEGFHVTDVVRCRQPGSEEQQDWAGLVARFPNVRFRELDSRTLFTAQSLPFSLTDLPATVSQFRRQVEALPVPSPLPPPVTLPPPPEAVAIGAIDPPQAHHSPGFHGGEAAGFRHLQQYFDSHWPALYMARRDELEGWHHSTKLSPWLATGCLSPRTVVHALREYQAAHGQRCSSEEIYAELLRREYFQWYGFTSREALLSFPDGESEPLGTSSRLRFDSWCSGNTPWPLVNACMRELNTTGYLRNRGRQLVASCFVHELQLDWRYGAAYFEQQLIDHDAAINWGNWQRLAGSEGRRYFELAQQPLGVDPEGNYIRRWQGYRGRGVGNSHAVESLPSPSK